MTTASRSGRSCSSCQTGIASASSAASAQSASPSSCDPGYAITPTRGCGLAMDLDLVRLHQRIREQLLAHLLDLRTRFGWIGRIDLEIDHLADSRGADREAEMLEGRFDGIALRIENALLRADE